jgi:hypothetical protein
MPSIKLLFLSLALCFAAILSGCGGTSEPNKTASKSELQQYLAEHPELADAEMAELNE